MPYLRNEVAKLANMNLETIRYYEQIGLIQAPARSEAGYRLYSDEVFEQLALIRHAKECGFTLNEIRKARLKAASGGIGMQDFIALIDRKALALEKEIEAIARTRAKLNELREGLLAAEKSSGMQGTIDMLQVKV
ncbi:MerR family transcriptional regulator [Paenibacillus aurantiacus]|uniref:MerR family transcriptional regulator n=1 Tax=Paenibacillus aurantiacus TaxID=1936118 RepID=A0ABV5KTR0_9BACL